MERQRDGERNLYRMRGLCFLFSKDIRRAYWFYAKVEIARFNRFVYPGLSAWLKKSMQKCP
jgi:3-hydroxymyristoyl/3-hydroxydecanoyl-(acyl carrier protein) dehydratase